MPGSDSRREPAIEDLVAVGIVRRSHGVRGEMSVEPLTDSLDRFAELDHVWLVAPERDAARPTRVESTRIHGDRALLKLAGIDAPEPVRALGGWTIEVAPEDVRQPDAGEYFLHDLVGLSVVAPDGRAIGAVEDVAEGGGGLLLTVRRPDGGAFEMPFAASFCLDIDVGAGRITAELPEGLEDLDAGAQPARQDERQKRTRSARLRVDFVTIFPDMFAPLLEEGVIARATEAGILALRVWDLRNFTADRHRSTDDVPYGGGSGMVMLAEPVFRCLDAIRAEASGSETPLVILTSPQGERFDHETARGLAERQWLVFLCGRYEGYDERVREALVDRELSVGDFVVSGGELPAMLMADAVARLVEGVVGDWNSVEADSFYTGLLDHPHFTRPAELRGLEVPSILLSGHAEKIRKWRREQSLRNTLLKRPDLLEGAELDEEALRILGELREQRNRDGESGPEELKRKRR